MMESVRRASNSRPFCASFCFLCRHVVRGTKEQVIAMESVRRGSLPLCALFPVFVRFANTCRSPQTATLPSADRSSDNDSV